MKRTGGEKIFIKMTPSHYNHNQSLFSFQDPGDFSRLRGVFEKAGYTDKGILEALGVKDVPSIRGSDVPLLIRRTSRGTPLDTLIRLFLIEAPCDLQNLLVAFDRPRMLQTDLRQNYVMGIGRSTLTLANLTVRRHARLTLDLGTGCGIQAFLAAPHSDRVLAVDRNPRAVQIATFNAKLNGISQVECLEGDFFEPVREKSFDLVIANPPFVISPEMRYIYRDGGMPTDQTGRKIVREVPQFLDEGGYCQILCNWIESAGQDWRERLHGWFEGTGCDVWVMRSESLDAETYASTWIRHTERDEPEEFARRFEGWMAYYEKQGIDAIGAGLITMRRISDRANWFRADDAPEKILGPCGGYILRGFELRDFLETVRDDAALLNTRMRVSPDVRLERQSVPSAEGWVDAVADLHLTRGLAYSGRIDPYVANLVVACNGQRILRDLLANMATSLKVDTGSITSTFCNVVRGLIERGFLLPAHFED